MSNGVARLQQQTARTTRSRRCWRKCTTSQSTKLPTAFPLTAPATSPTTLPSPFLEIESADGCVHVLLFLGGRYFTQVVEREGWTMLEQKDDVVIRAAHILVLTHSSSSSISFIRAAYLLSLQHITYCSDIFVITATYRLLNWAEGRCRRQSCDCGVTCEVGCFGLLVLDGVSLAFTAHPNHPNWRFPVWQK